LEDSILENKTSIWSPVNRQLLLFIMVGVFLGATSGMYETSFNNYLNSVFKISPEVRGWLAFPRELPGFLVAVLSGLLFFMVEVRMAIIAVLAMCVGLMGLGHLSPGFHLMMVWMIVWSVGNHLYMPLGDSIGIMVSPKDKVGKTLGMLGGASTAATILGCAVVWLGMDYWKLGYSSIFIIASASALGAAICLLFMDPKYGRTADEVARKKSGASPQFVFKKRYSLFYWLNVLYGARKQVFITFGPWVLIKVFEQPASIIAKLWIASAILGIFFRPALGRAIDSLGEKKILCAEAVLLIFVCAGYGFGSKLGFGDKVVWLLYVCYVADQMLLAVGMARTTYLNKVIDKKEDLMPTLSMGVSINHAVSMLIPSLGGWAWANFGYEWVFVGAAAIAVINFAVAGLVSVPSGSASGETAIGA
jgi:predicted MFS family arabinose efflux permease